jgi:hypothetical protein
VVTKSTATEGCSNAESGPITVTFQGVAKATEAPGNQGRVGVPQVQRHIEARRYRRPNRFLPRDLDRQADGQVALGSPKNLEKQRRNK